MVKRISFIVLSLGIAVIFVTRCGSSSSSTGSAISSISSLPAATGPVVASSISKAFQKAAGVQLFSATTGVKLSELDSITWSGSTKSRPFCESGRLIKEAYLQAAEPDKILCYIGAMKDSGLFASDVDDGNYKFYTVGGAGRPGGDGLRVKFKIVKSGSSITAFEMFMCKSDDGTTFTQEGYVSTDVSNANASTVTTKFIQTTTGENSHAFATQTSATGAVNSSGNWTSKAITMENTSSFGSGGGTGSYRQKSTITQQPTKVLLDAFMAGTYGNFTFTNQLYSVVQTLNTTSLATFALGDGSAKYILSNAQTGGTTQSFNSTASWLGDTQAPLSPASSGEQYETANAATPRSVESVTVAYTTAQTWNCSADSSFSTANLAGSSTIQAGIAACDSKYGGNDRGYLECRNSSGE